MQNKQHDYIDLELLRHSIITKSILKWKVVLATAVVFAVLGGLIGLLPSQKYEAHVLVEPSKKQDVSGHLGRPESSYIIDSSLLLEHVRRIKLKVDDVNQVCSIIEADDEYSNNHNLKFNADIVKISPVLIKFTLSGDSIATLINCMETVLKFTKTYEDEISNELTSNIINQINENDYILSKLRKKYQNNYQDVGYSEEIKILLNANYAAKNTLNFIKNNQIKVISKINIIPIPTRIFKIILASSFLGIIVSIFIISRAELRRYCKCLFITPIT